MTNTRSKVTAQDFKDRVKALANADPALKALTPDPAVAKPLREGSVPMDKVVEGLLLGYADRPALGERAYNVVQDRETGKAVRVYRTEYETTTNRELLRRARAIAMAWRYHRELQIDRDSLVVQVGFTGIDFSILDIACALSHTVSVPLQSQMTATDFEEIFAKTNPSVLAATVSDIVAMTEQAIKHGGIQNLVVFDFDERVSQEQDERTKAQELINQNGGKIRLLSLQELIDEGADFEWEPLEPHPKGGNRMALLLHSSGSTGKPKGAVFTEKLVRKTFWWPSLEGHPTVSVGFAPLNHGMGRSSVARALVSGGNDIFHHASGSIDPIRGYSPQPPNNGFVHSSRHGSCLPALPEGSRASCCGWGWSLRTK